MNHLLVKFMHYYFSYKHSYRKSKLY